MIQSGTRGQVGGSQKTQGLRVSVWHHGATCSILSEPSRSLLDCCCSLFYWNAAFPWRHSARSEKLFFPSDGVWWGRPGLGERLRWGSEVRGHATVSFKTLKVWDTSAAGFVWSYGEFTVKWTTGEQQRRGCCWASDSLTQTHSLFLPKCKHEPSPLSRPFFSHLSLRSASLGCCLHLRPGAEGRAQQERRVSGVWLTGQWWAHTEGVRGGGQRSESHGVGESRAGETDRGGGALLTRRGGRTHDRKREENLRYWRWWDETLLIVDPLVEQRGNNRGSRNIFIIKYKVIKDLDKLFSPIT